MDYIEQLEIQVQNNQRSIYDVSGLLNEYVEMKKDVSKLQKHMKTRFGSDAQIPTGWSKFFKVLKHKYLALKKRLDFKK